MNTIMENDNIPDLNDGAKTMVERLGSRNKGTSDLDTFGALDQSCKDDFDEEKTSPSRFHHFYLQEDGMQFMKPIVFEDGMDYDECELYYHSIDMQRAGGTLRRIPAPQFRRASCRGIDEMEDDNCNPERGDSNVTKLRSCLRKTKRFSKYRNPSKPLSRGCSFTVKPNKADACPFLVRSNSVQSLDGNSPKVSFEEYVEVVTVHSVHDYPKDVRSAMWMTREEMAIAVRDSMIDDLREECEQLKQQQLALAQERRAIEKERLENLRSGVERVPSIDSVITECVHSVRKDSDSFRGCEEWRSSIVGFQ